MASVEIITSNERAEDLASAISEYVNALDDRTRGSGARRDDAAYTLATIVTSLWKCDELGDSLRIYISNTATVSIQQPASRPQKQEATPSSKARSPEDQGEGIETISVQEVSEMLGISTRLTYQMLKEGQLPARRAGNKKWLIGRQAILEWLKNKEKEGEQKPIRPNIDELRAAKL